MGSQTYLTSKPRYDILDGLRGVAALLVVCYHLLETYFHSSPAQPLNHGYLAWPSTFSLLFRDSSSDMLTTTAGVKCQCGILPNGASSVCTQC